MLLFLTLAGSVLALVACTSSVLGYRPGAGYESDVGTIAVELFDNQTFSPGTESMLAEAIIKDLQRRTPYRVTGTERADTVLTGSIVSEDLVTLSLGRATGMVQEQAVRLTVDFAWSDRRSGEVRVSRRGFSASEAFVPSRGVGERIDVGRIGATQELASAIVAEIRGGW